MLTRHILTSISDQRELKLPLLMGTKREQKKLKKAVDISNQCCILLIINRDTTAWESKMWASDLDRINSLVISQSYAILDSWIGVTVMEDYTSVVWC